jgi:hypothetical protein
MTFPSIGNHYSKESSFEKISHIDKDFGMIASRQRLRRILRVESREVVHRTWLLSVRKGRKKEIFLVRRVTMMEDHHHHSQGRRT